MPKKTLTAKSLAALKCGGIQTAVFAPGAHIPAFGIRLSPKRKTWFLLYRKNGRLVRYKVGTYPPMELADARETARRAWLGTQVEDTDPAAAKKARRTAMTFETLAERFVEDYAKPHKDSWRDDARRLRTIALPKWKTRPAADIAPADVRELLRAVATKRGGVTANRTRALLSKLFRWATAEGYLDSNPAGALPTRIAETPRDRELTSEEIVTLFGRLDDADIFDPTIALGLKLRLLLGQRGDTINRMQWAQLDLKVGVWYIPADQMKAGRPHVVPLPPEVLTLLKAQRKVVEKDAAYVLDGGRARRLRLGITDKMGIENAVP